MRLFPVLLFFSLCFAVYGDEASKQAPARTTVAVMVSDDHYDADKLLPPLMQRLAKENDWDLLILHGNGGADFPNIGVLDKVDVLVIYVRRLALPKEQLAVLKNYVASGRGLVGLRTASHAFESKAKSLPEGSENWPEFDRDVLGGNYDDHGRNELGSDIQNVPEQKDSAILKNVNPDTWHSAGSLYFNAPLKEGATIYQTASSEQRQNEPLTWTRLHGRTRVAYTALGHQKDFEVEAFQMLLRNLVQWAANRSEKP